jgi:AraC family transcriptional regulator
MEWIDRMNEAISYIEDNLDGEISLEKAACIAYSSQYQFQRIFSYMAGIPLSAYIRQRRLTKAAVDLQNGGKVIDVALRFGYNSATAFNRAFQAVHGISPSAAQKPKILLKAYPRITFQIIIKGVTQMEYRIVKKEAFRIVGVRTPLKPEVEANFKNLPVFWDKTFKSGIIPQILGLMNGEPQGLLGASTDSRGESENYYYIAVVSDKPVPENMFEFNIPANTWAVFSGSGKPQSIQELQKRIFTEWQPSSGYEWASETNIEVYLDDDPVSMKYEVWLPVVKKS